MTVIDDRRDLFCLHCGYNLRGQSGDPRRCPECGQESTVADMLIPAGQIRKALRRLESGPALATTMYLAIVVWLGPICFVIASKRFSPADPTLWTIIVAMIGTCLVLWVVGVWMFRSSARGHPGWMGALVRFHLYGTAVAACGIAIMGSAIWCALAVANSLPAIPVLPIAACAVLIVAAIFGMRWIAERAKMTIAPIQRACAADMIRRNKSIGTG